MANSTPDSKPIPDESPFLFYKLRQHLPRWLRRFLPTGGGHHHREANRSQELQHELMILLHGQSHNSYCRAG